MAAKKANWLQVAFWHFVEFQLGCRLGARTEVSGWGWKVCKKWKGQDQGAIELAGGWPCKRNAERRIFLLKLEKQLPALRAAKAAALVSRLTTQKVRQAFTFYTMHFNFAELVLKVLSLGLKLFTHKWFFKPCYPTYYADFILHNYYRSWSTKILNLKTYNLNTFWTAVWTARKRWDRNLTSGLRRMQATEIKNILFLKKKV